MRVSLGGAQLDSDAAVVVVGIAALVAAVRDGFARLRPALPLWLAAATLLIWILVRTQTLDHAVTAVKFCEYALLALSAPLLLRRRSDYEFVAAVIAAWSVVASFVGVLQFFGADVAGAWPAGRRQPSFLGHFDFAAFEGMVLAVGASSLLLEPFLRRAAAGAAVVASVLGLLLAGATAGA